MVWNCKCPQRALRSSLHSQACCSPIGPECEHMGRQTCVCRDPRHSLRGGRGLRRATPESRWAYVELKAIRNQQTQGKLSAPVITRNRTQMPLRRGPRSRGRGQRLSVRPSSPATHFTSVVTFPQLPPQTWPQCCCQRAGGRGCQSIGQSVAQFESNPHIMLLPDSH